MRESTKRKIVPYLFLAPFLIIFLVFMLYPVIYSVVVSFMKYKNGTFTPVGWKNFTFLLTDPLLYKSLGNTFIILIIEVPIQTFLALIFANLLNGSRLKGRGLFRMFIFMPVLIDTVSYSIVFGLFFSTNGGLINRLLAVFGAGPIDWVNGAFTAKLIIIFAMLWRWIGYNTVIILGGLQNIPGELYEAAAIDGASPVRQFFSITLPGVKQVTIFSVVLSVNGALQLFTEPYLLTRGGPVNETMTIVHYLYQTGFKSFNFGVASAGAYVLAILIAILTLIQLRVTKEDEA